MISTRHMSYNKQTNTLAVEISSLGPSFEWEWAYPGEACDLGVTVVSHVTGKKIKFAENKVNYDGEGDITSWELIPAKRTKDPRINLMRLIIFND